MMPSRLRPVAPFLPARCDSFAVYLIAWVWGAFVSLGGAIAPCRAADAATKPNIVVIFCDDLGYADIGPLGAQGYSTPNLDRMAADGRKFTDFYVAQAVCSASRTALLTGCYPNRVGILGALGPKSDHGIADSETTLGEALKGKWHKVILATKGFNATGDGVFHFARTVALDGLEERRARAGLPPMDQYVCMLEEAGMKVDHASLPAPPPR